MNIEEIKEEIKARRKRNSHPIIKKKRQTKYLTKIFLVIIITLILLIGLKKSPKFENLFYQHVYEENINFGWINQLYQKYFGSSIPFSGLIQNDVQPVFKEKLSYKKQEKYQDGVKLTVSTNYLVPVMDSGMVVFIGEKESYGKTVIIQQIDGTDVWYANIESPSIKLYDYVEKGSLLGEVKGDFLFLVFRRDGKVVDYAPYID